MSALVCGKRNAFEDLSSPGASPPAAQQKRARFRSGSSPSRYLGVSQSESGGGSVQEKILVLHGLFPSMTSEELQRALEECGYDLDLTIKGLNLLCLGSSELSRDSERLHHTGSRSHGSPEDRAAPARGHEAPPAAALDSSCTAAPAVDHTESVGQAVSQTAPEASQQGQAAAGPSSGPEEGRDSVLGSVLSVEWVDAVVQEMMSAKDLDDARQRAARALQSFGNAVLERARAAREQDVSQLKEQVATLQRENHILKKAVAIQHERHLAHEAREAEVNALKQMLGQYQEQLRKLEVNNYALTLHLQKAQVDSSMPNRFHPDVF